MPLKLNSVPMYEVYQVFDQKLGLQDAAPRDVLLYLGTTAILIYIMVWLVRYLLVLYEVRGLFTIHSGIEFFEHGFREKLPNIPFVVPANKFFLDDPWKKYAIAHSDLIASTQLSTPSHAVYITSSPEVCTMISNNVSIFSRPTEMFRYSSFTIFGMTLVSTADGSEHRKHRNVVKGCFSECVMANAWDKMVFALDTMKKEEGIEEGGTVGNVLAACIKLTMLVIGRAGFGVDIPWQVPHTTRGEMSFAEAFHVLETTLLYQLVLPQWLMSYFPLASIRRMGRGQKWFLKHSYNMYEAKRSELHRFEEEAKLTGEKFQAPSDILGALVHSQMDTEAEARIKSGHGGDGKRLTGLMEEEIIGNMFLFIIAGHETTGHTLTWAQAWLALYPEWQDRVFEEVMTVCGDELPSYRHMNKLPLTLAVSYETLRLQDIALVLPKKAMENTVVPYTTWDDQGNVIRRTRAVPRGARVVLDPQAAGLNPFYHERTSIFDPSRFLDLDSKKNFLGFSQGVRGCIGKRFAEVEMTAFLSHLIKEYTLHIVPEPGEKFEDTKRRMTKGHMEVIFTPPNFKIRYERRAR